MGNGRPIVGLGYSLNKMRAPTPWIRKPAEEGEWLIAEDLEDMREVDGLFAGLGIAWNSAV